MIRVFTFLSFCLLLYACQSVDRKKEPTTLLDEAKMVQLLTDIAYIKAAKSTNSQIVEKNNINPKLYILGLHGIDSTVFAENNAWYSNNMEVYGGILQKVKVKLEKQRDRYELLKIKEDSVSLITDAIKVAKDSVYVDYIKKH